MYYNNKARDLLLSDRDRSKDKNGGKKKSGRGWALRVFVLAVVLSALLSFFSTTALEGTGYVVAALVLAVFIGLGIVFDMIGVAVTAADPKPFHSMAAHKEKGAKAAIRLLQNANQVSSVCNDVVGDICGIVSGSTAAVIVTHLQRDLSTTSVLISIGATALISGFIAKESVVSTLQVLLGNAAITSLFTTRSAISFLVFTLLYTPCIAAVATIRRELGSRIKTVGVVLLQCVVAWLAAYIAYAVGGLLR